MEPFALEVSGHHAKSMRNGPPTFQSIQWGTRPGSHPQPNPLPFENQRGTYSEQNLALTRLSRPAFFLHPCRHTCRFASVCRGAHSKDTPAATQNEARNFEEQHAEAKGQCKREATSRSKRAPTNRGRLQASTVSNSAICMEVGVRRRRQSAHSVLRPLKTMNREEEDDIILNLEFYF
ncbi:hypothetical protein MLD38_018167 [Melastoma candidum]|uniref:Uncharacterized protein n=1 Tax=Melastoma candidum TaxID=119954 RepID=A0ACB9QW40_9MYRT|nr:hypothetical protein MLD38_018167 [Melastoma candidum]